MATSSRLLTVGFSPRRHRLLLRPGFYPVSNLIGPQGYHLQGSLPSVGTAISIHFPAYPSCLISSSHLSYTVHTVIQITFIHLYTIHSYINTFTYSYTSYAQHQFTHGCISHPKSCSAASALTHHVSSGQS